MIYTLLGVLPLILLGAATIVAAFTLDGESSLQGWAIAIFSTLSLAFGMLSYSTHLLDLATLIGSVLFGGIAGAGWNPRGRRALLLFGFFCLIVGLIPHLGAMLVAGGGVGAGGVLGGSSLSWAVARSAGFVAFLSATGAVLLGVRRPARLPVGGLPARLYALHRAFGVTAILALALHLIALRLDTFISFSWAQLLVAPWTSSYRPVAVTIGALAMISLILTAASGGLRKLLPGWRFVHAASYLTFGLSIVHGLLAGSDAGSPEAIFLYLAALLAVGVTLLRRYFPASPGKQTRSAQKKPERRSRPVTWP